MHKASEKETAFFDLAISCMYDKEVQESVRNKLFDLCDYFRKRGFWSVKQKSFVTDLLKKAGYGKKIKSLKDRGVI